MIDKRPLRRSNHWLPNTPIPLKEVAGGFFLVTENGRCKQLRGFGLMPFAEWFGVQPYIVYYVGESSGTERPAFEVAHDLGLCLPDNITTFRCQIWAQIFWAKCWHQFRSSRIEPFAFQTEISTGSPLLSIVRAVVMFIAFDIAFIVESLSYFSYLLTRPSYLFSNL